MNPQQLNQKQIVVLHWIRDGCPDGVYTDGWEHRIIARALERRGLVRISGRGPTWIAEITSEGVAWQPPPIDNVNSVVEVGSRDEPESGSRAAAAAHAVPPGATEETIPLPTHIRKPHPAIRELLDHNQRVDVPSEVRHRAHLILHALVAEAVRRGWTVTPVVSVMRADWNGVRKRVWPSEDLFTIDAGHAPAALRLRMKQRKVDHVPTKEEIAHEERFGWRNYNQHDLVATDRMRLEVGAGRSGSLVIEDSVATTIESKLVRALVRVRAMSDEALKRAEAHQRYAAQQEIRQRAEAELLQRALKYGKWVEALEELQSAHVKHRALSTLVDGLRAVAVIQPDQGEDTAQLMAFLTWADAYVQQSDPLRAVSLPDGVPPDLTYEQWLGLRGRRAIYIR